MTWRHTFTPEMDAKIIAAIESGATSWSEVGAAIGRAGPIARQRIERGLRRPDLIEVMQRRRLPSPTASQPPQRSGADALPVGHPLTWGRLVAGTVLDGAVAAVASRAEDARGMKP